VILGGKWYSSREPLPGDVFVTVDESQEVAAEASPQERLQSKATRRQEGENHASTGSSGKSSEAATLTLDKEHRKETRQSNPGQVHGEIREAQSEENEEGSPLFNHVKRDVRGGPLRKKNQSREKEKGTFGAPRRKEK